MKKSILITAATLAYCILVTASCFSQGTAINNSGTPADSSAILDVSSTTQGLLIPRMSEAQKNAVPRPAPSLMIYQTDGTQPGYYFNAGDKTTKNWVYIGADDLGNHTATDSLDMSNKKIYNLATCTQNLDAANKEYVDSKVGAGGGGGGGSTGCASCITSISRIINNGSVMNWTSCVDSCHNLVYNNYNDWRVPTADEDIFYRSYFDAPGSGWPGYETWTTSRPFDGTNSYYTTFNWVTSGHVSRSNSSSYSCICVR